MSGLPRPAAEKVRTPFHDPTLRWRMLVVALVLNFVVILLVRRGRVSHVPTTLWIFSIVLFFLSAMERPSFRLPRWRPTGQTLLVIAVVLLPTIVRLAHAAGGRVHGDELLTAYFSKTHDFRQTSFFSPVPNRGEWVSQFPTPFFLLQRWFLDVAGTSVAAVRLSTLPYVVIVSVLLYRIGRRLVDRKTALLAVVLYAFFFPSVYLDVSGFMFISGTAAFLGFFDFALRNLHETGSGAAAASGVLMGACYLTYSSGYLALPVFLAFFLFDLARRRRFAVVRNLVTSLLGSWIVLSPFLSDPQGGQSYLFQRGSQVALIAGEWSSHRGAIAGGANPLAVVWANFTLAARAMYQDGIGGHGGYDFGRLALFDPLAIALLIAGAIAALVFVRRRPEILLVLIVIVASFFAGIVLTIPPPAYHRFSLAFPFLLLVMALPFSLLARTRIPAAVRFAVVAGSLLLFASVNEDRLARARLVDRPSDDERLARFLDDRYPDRALNVAAFPAYAFEKTYLFLKRPGLERPIHSGYHSDLLETFDRREKYVYVITFPEAFDEQFQEKDPAGKVLEFSPDYSVFAN
jgi:hypothetical protein